MSNRLDGEIKINKQEVLRYLEYNGQYINNELNNLIDECIEITKRKINPRYFLRVYPILRKNDNLGEDITYLKDCSLKFKSNDLYKLLNACEGCIILSVTLGLEIEREIRKYSYLELTKSIVLDACATTAIEEVCDLVQGKLDKEFKKDNKHLTMRYSPGYGDLDIQNNKYIIEALNIYKELGITINESNIMIPRKSVISIIGITYKNIDTQRKTCEICSNYKNCKYKKGDEVNGCKRVYKK